MKCPRCGEEMEQPTVDVGIGEIPCGPWSCDVCHWVDGLSDAEQTPDARLR
jgi:hypothetical protein